MQKISNGEFTKLRLAAMYEASDPDPAAAAIEVAQGKTSSEAVIWYTGTADQLPPMRFQPAVKP